MIDETHECPAPRCSKRLKFEHFACKRHWGFLTWDLKSKLLRLWRDDPGSDAYFEARAECLRALGVKPEDLAELNAGVS